MNAAMEATHPIGLDRLAGSGLGRTIRIPLPATETGPGGYRDLVVAEVRRLEDGAWEVYARPLSRPTTGRRLQVPYPDEGLAEIVASPKELGAIRETLAVYLRSKRLAPPAAGSDEALDVIRGTGPAEPVAVNVDATTPDRLTLSVDAAGTTWRVVI
jgi:hypothetical protein